MDFAGIHRRHPKRTPRPVRYHRYRQNTEDAIVCEARQQTHFIETVRGIGSVKLLGLEERRRATWLNYFMDTVNAKLRLQRLDLIFGRANDLLFGAIGWSSSFSARRLLSMVE